MRYLGGKHSLAKHIVPHIQHALSERGTGLYIEPFCGACSITSRVVAPERFAFDTHPYLIALLRATQKGWSPPTLTITPEEYNHIKYNKEQYDPAWVGLVGFACSFGAKWFDGFARSPRGQDFLGGGWQSLQQKMRKMDDVTFTHMAYQDLPECEDAVIYCDPPYAATTGYSGTAPFDSAAFWRWCQSRARTNTVLVSEFAVPSWVKSEILWEQVRRTKGCAKNNANVKELLVRVLPQTE